MDVIDRGFHRLDTCGLFCPEPMMLLHKIIKTMAAGDIVEMTASDPSTYRDVPKFCQFLGHQLHHCERQEDVFLYRIEK